MPLAGLKMTMESPAWSTLRSVTRPVARSPTTGSLGSGSGREGSTGSVGSVGSVVPPSESLYRVK